MKTKFFGFAVLTLALLSVQASAQKKTGSDLRDAVERVNKASAVMTEIMSIAEKSIPRDLLAKANAVVVFPGAIKGAFIVGGQGGKGVAVRRVAKGWSAPAFFNMAGGSIGLQIGGSKFWLSQIHESGHCASLSQRIWQVLVVASQSSL